MGTQIGANNLQAPTSAAVSLPRPARVAAIGGALLAALLLAFDLPLLAAGGLWLLGLAVVLIGYALVVHRHFETAMWDTAILGQGLGMLGVTLLFAASLLG
jgi:hypothetical protein